LDRWEQVVLYPPHFQTYHRLDPKLSFTLRIFRQITCRVFNNLTHDLAVGSCACLYGSLRSRLYIPVIMISEARFWFWIRQNPEIITAGLGVSYLCWEPLPQAFPHAFPHLTSAPKGIRILNICKRYKTFLPYHFSTSSTDYGAWNVYTRQWSGTSKFGLLPL
jgi:hypothetical protein